MPQRADTVVHSSNPSIQEAETEDGRGVPEPGRHSKILSPKEKRQRQTAGSPQGAFGRGIPGEVLPHNPGAPWMYGEVQTVLRICFL